MTEYELASLFNETQADIVSGVSLYVSMLFGFIVASYLAAHHLNRAMMDKYRPLMREHYVKEKPVFG